MFGVDAGRGAGDVGRMQTLLPVHFHAVSAGASRARREPVFRRQVANHSHGRVDFRGCGLFPDTKAGTPCTPWVTARHQSSGFINRSPS